ncbi:hypothetical protein [Microcoleus sp. FACHB-672]|uniref:hypothetical protein n=1 Tax=Microcoleus sp. FACHB-672 TaxID=2692825 RepID=UPI0016829E09|nr:hypothetical protein [Microcoleus sp. FACHB-672]MBD2041980.1 hypothetical protein [Microcoleus sp. FACHB-672]
MPESIGDTEFMNINLERKNFYCPIAKWSGRLILPSLPERRSDGGVYLEVQNTPDSHAQLKGKKVWVTWHSTSCHRKWLHRAVIDIHFDEITRKSMEENHFIHPIRLDGWSKVSPLESLAGGSSIDDVQVELDVVSADRDGNSWVLAIGDEPYQIAGIDKALSRFIAPAGEKRYRVRHYNPSSRSFDGPEEVIALPDAGTVLPGTSIEQTSIKNIEKSSLNASGWYIYGSQDASGSFTVKALEPAEMFKLVPTRMVIGRDESRDYITDLKWDNIPLQRVERTLLDNNGGVVPFKQRTPALIAKRTKELWSVGDVALVVHTYGWRGGERGDKVPLGIVPGHFAFGFAKVVRDEFTGELRFDLVYRQVYAHNREGVIAGAMRWHLYMGSLRHGWMYTLPISDVLVRLPELTVPYRLGNHTFNPLIVILQELALMTAKYRAGGGNGASLVTPAASCVKDSSQALFAAGRRLENEVVNDSVVKGWLDSNPNSYEAKRFRRLESLLNDVESTVLIPWGIVPKGWGGDNENVAAHLKDGAITPASILEALKAWKTMMPRRAEIELLKVLLEHGATMVDCQGAMLGGEVPGIVPLAPTVIF